MNLATDTIVAVATPPGIGGIGIVRMSGPDTVLLAGHLLGGLPEARVATVTRFRGPDGIVIDRGLALYFPAPASYTGEDVLELHAHGGPVVLSLLVDAAVAFGARRAAPGEFSKRAFMNDKLDLVQAEAVADLIASGTRQAAQAALRSLAGEFSQSVYWLAAELTTLRVHVEAAIDFPDEEVDFLADPALAGSIRKCASAFDALLENAAAGRVLRDGFRVVIAGRPNAGKSSLMNRLSGEDTAIVTEVAGTTRDILRETIDMDGLSVELVDTAGLREDPGVIEQEGIRRAHAAMRSADAVLWLRDASVPDSGPPADLPRDLPVLHVDSKIDLVGHVPGDVLGISAHSGAGIDELRERLKGLAGYRNLGEGAFTARRRHVEALQAARAHFERGQQALHAGGAGELLAEELRLAQDALGAITGEMTPDDLLGRIFSEFCIGK